MHGIDNWKHASEGNDLTQFSVEDWAGALASGAVELQDYPGFFITRFGDVWKGPWVQTQRTGKMVNQSPRLLARIGRNFAYVSIDGKFVNWQRLKDEVYPPQ